MAFVLYSVIYPIRGVGRENCPRKKQQMLFSITSRNAELLSTAAK